MSFDVELEKDVLSTCLHDVAFVRSANPVLRRHDFSSKVLSWVWRVISETYSDSREIPSGSIFAIRLDRDFDKDEEREFAEEVLRGLLKRQVSGPRSALAEIRRFVRLAALRNAASGAIDGLELGDLDEAEKALSQGIERTRSANLLTEPMSWAEQAGERLKLYEQKDSTISIRTPLPSLDKVMNGGLKPGTIGLVVALTNVGKSSFAVSLGYAALMKSKSVVVHVSTEETIREAGARYDSRFTGISRNKLLAGDLTQSERDLFVEKFKRRGHEIGSSLLLHELPPGSNISNVQVLAERARELYPDRPITLVVDSADHLHPARKTESFRLDTSSVYWTLKGLSLDPTLAPISVWVTSQVPQKYAGKALKATSVSESQDKSRIADFMIGLTEGEVSNTSTAGTKTVHCDVLKNRLGSVKHWRIYMEADHGTCTFTEVASCSTEDEDEDE